MAEAVLKVLLENLGSLIHKEIGLFLGTKQEMKRLSSTLSTIQAVLQDAEMKQFTDRAIRDWLRKLKDAALELDDVLDECATEALRSEYQREKCRWPKLVQNSCLSSFNCKSLLLRRRIGKKMKEIRETLDDIAEQRKMFQLRETISLEERKPEVMEWRQTTSFITQPQVYGREEDKERIVESLIGHLSDSEHVSVYPIVGIGGLGKTTLAQLVFNDERVTKHFELKIWVCVSDDFSMKRMTKAILESASQLVCGDLDLDPLQKQLQERLQRRRYLIVLDDVWNEDQEKWDRFKYVLACGSKGSSILVTTRLTKVALIMGTLPPHRLSCLCYEDCWSLFKQRAFGQDNKASAELVAIGKEIVKKCKGLPLAAKALGGLLRFKSQEKDWLYVKESELWELPQDENSVLPALKLSYLNLPLKSRQCFSYCALFPKDSYIYREQLIHLWMANGFISSTGKWMAEDIGDEVINELCWRSFFQDILRDHVGNILHFKMHDLVHDLAQSVVDDVCFITNYKTTIDHPTRIHHLMFYKYFEVKLPCTLYQAEFLRTLLCQYCFGSPDIRRLGSLRALVLGSNMVNTKLLSSITQCKHLRYLNLGGADVKKLPESICTLWNLQVLDLAYCRSLRSLPYHLKRLKALQHLYLRRCTSLSCMSPEMGQLTSLRTLNIFSIGQGKGFGLAELGGLSLKGELHIKKLGRVRSAMDAKKANLMHKQLDELLLSWDRKYQSEMQEYDEQILEALEPHQKLIALGVGGYRGARFPQWMGNPSFKNLSHIQLMDCKYSLELPPLGKLPSLKVLKIHNMPHVRYIDGESNNCGIARGFTSLESLSLSYLPNLERLSKEQRENIFPCLSKLSIAECPRFALPCIPSVSKLTVINSCNNLRLGSVSASALPCRPSSNDPSVGNSNQVLLDSIHNLHGLEFLWLYDDQELTSFPVGMLRDLTCLKELLIFDQSKLEVLPTEDINLNSLEELYIRGCHSLESFTEQALKGLPSLQRLKIDRCDNFKCLSSATGFLYLTSLHDIIIARCPQLILLPEDLKHVPCLQSLSLYQLPNLACLPDWLGNLRSLQSLYIAVCPKLMSLPSSFQCLTSLKSLTIAACPELQKRLAMETGEDWHKISHIWHVNLGNSGITPEPEGLTAVSLSIYTGQGNFLTYLRF